MYKGVYMANVKLNITSDVFNKIYRPYIKYTAPTEIFYGGSSSGKSYFLAQRLVLDVAAGGHNYLVVRKVAQTLRKSVYNEVTKAINFFKLQGYFSINKTDLVITCNNGYQILFTGMDDQEKVKSITPAKGVITDFWYEEATESTYEDIQQLDKRLRGVSKVKKRGILSFNPIYQTHWIYKAYFEGHWADDSKLYKDDRVLILKTTYKDNAFLTQDDIVRLENTEDKYYRNVYLLGNWGILGKSIFTNWGTDDLSQMKFTDFNNGLDFGFGDDPCALVRCHYDKKNKRIFITKAKYLYACPNDLLAAEATAMFDLELVMCDGADIRLISELRQLGVSATAAYKPKGSINFGIQWLQQQQVIIDYRLTDMINEFTVYKWLEDKDGIALPKAIDKNNHLIDSLRYALSVEMGIVRNMDNDGKPQFALSGGSPIADYKNASNSNSGLSFSRPNNYNPLRR